MKKQTMSILNKSVAGLLSCAVIVSQSVTMTPVKASTPPKSSILSALGQALGSILPQSDVLSTMRANPESPECRELLDMMFATASTPEQRDKLFNIFMRPASDKHKNILKIMAEACAAYKKEPLNPTAKQDMLCACDLGRQALLSDVIISSVSGPSMTKIAENKFIENLLGMMKDDKLNSKAQNKYIEIAKDVLGCRSRALEAFRECKFALVDCVGNARNIDTTYGHIFGVLTACFYKSEYHHTAELLWNLRPIFIVAEEKSKPLTTKQYSVNDWENEINPSIKALKTNYARIIERKRAIIKHKEEEEKHQKEEEAQARAREEKARVRKEKEEKEARKKEEKAKRKEKNARIRKEEEAKRLAEEENRRREEKEQLKLKEEQEARIREAEEAKRREEEAKRKKAEEELQREHDKSGVTEIQRANIAIRLSHANEPNHDSKGLIRFAPVSNAE